MLVVRGSRPACCFVVVVANYMIIFSAKKPREHSVLHTLGTRSTLSVPVSRAILLYILKVIHPFAEVASAAMSVPC